MSVEENNKRIEEEKANMAGFFPYLPSVISKDDAIRSLCYLEGFLGGIFKAYGEDPHCKRQLDNLWSYVDGRKIKLQPFDGGNNGT